MLVRSLPTKSRKRLARDVFDTFATHARLVYDVIDRLLGTKWQHSRSCFGDFETLIFKLMIASRFGFRPLNWVILEQTVKPSLRRLVSFKTNLTFSNGKRLVSK